MRVLVADDDNDDFLILSDVFSSMDGEMKLDRATDGAQLIKYLYENVQSANGLPDVVILDLNMPKVDGMQALSVLRKEEAFKNIPVFVYTTSSDREQADRCRRSGANACFVKSCNYDTIRSFAEFVIRWASRNDNLNEPDGSGNANRKPSSVWFR